MNDYDFVSKLGRLYYQILSMRDDRDYVINQSQMDKLVQISEFLMEEAQRQDGRIDPVLLSPREIHGGITAHFLVFDLHGERLAKFCGLMSCTSAFGIDSTLDGVCISCTVPDVFVPIAQMEEPFAFENEEE